MPITQNIKRKVPDSLFLFTLGSWKLMILSIWMGLMKVNAMEIRPMIRKTLLITVGILAVMAMAGCKKG